MTFDKYRAVKALNWSSLKPMAASPLHYAWNVEHPRPDTPALILGRAIHARVLEPDSYRDRYIVAEAQQCAALTKKGERCSKPATPGTELCSVHGGGEELAVLLDSGVEILTADQGAAVELAAAAVAAHPDASRLLVGTRREEVVTWSSPSGVPCKGRLDAVSSERVLDLKTTRDLGRFDRQSADLLYHGQVAWYLDGAVAAGITSADAEAYIVAVESTPPYDVGVKHLGGEILVAGRLLYRRLLATWEECRRRDYWPGRCSGIEELELPRWYDSSEEAW